MKVFLSSTYKDLSIYRQPLIEYLKRVSTQLGAMEYFYSSPDTPLDKCLKEIDESDVVILVVGYRYGSIHPSANLSFTELEYNHARELKKDIFVFLASENLKRDLISIDRLEFHTNKDLIAAFRQKLTVNHTLSYFESPRHLLELLKVSLKEEYEYFRQVDEVKLNMEEFFTIIESHPVRNLAFEISEYPDENSCFRGIEELITWGEETFATLSQSSDNIESDLKKLFLRLDLDPSLIDNIPYYENPLIHREWELLHIGLPNFLYRLKILMSLLELYTLDANNEIEKTLLNERTEKINTRLKALLQSCYVD